MAIKHCQIYVLCNTCVYDTIRIQRTPSLVRTYYYDSYGNIIRNFLHRILYGQADYVNKKSCQNDNFFICIQKRSTNVVVYRQRIRHHLIYSFRISRYHQIIPRQAPIFRIGQRQGGYHAVHYRNSQ